MYLLLVYNKQHYICRFQVVKYDPPFITIIRSSVNTALTPELIVTVCLCGCRATHGTQSLSREEIIKHYGPKREWKHFNNLNTTFTRSGKHTHTLNWPLIPWPENHYTIRCGCSLTRIITITTYLKDCIWHILLFSLLFAIALL